MNVRRMGWRGQATLLAMIPLGTRHPQVAHGGPVVPSVIPVFGLAAHDALGGLGPVLISTRVTGPFLRVYISLLLLLHVVIGPLRVEIDDRRGLRVV